MGNLNAVEFAESVRNNEVQLDQALNWHITANHYPPVNPVFIPTCKKAIELANQGNWDEVIVMPNKREKTVSEIIRGLHLEAFLEQEE